jgi:hypothetical protein
MSITLVHDVISCVSLYLEAVALSVPGTKVRVPNQVRNCLECEGVQFGRKVRTLQRTLPLYSIYSLLCIQSLTFWGRDSSVGTATSYGLDGPGIESRWGREFSHSSRLALGPTQPPIQ